MPGPCEQLYILGSFCMSFGRLSFAMSKGTTWPSTLLTSSIHEILVGHKVMLVPSNMTRRFIGPIVWNSAHCLQGLSKFCKLELHACIAEGRRRHIGGRS
jgi:hypothetical protein